MNTRFYNDHDRQVDRLRQSTYAGRYMLDVPGPGDQVGYVPDPHIRLQKWGANMWTNAIDLETEMSGRNQIHSRCPRSADLLSRVPQSQPISYGEDATAHIVDESRTFEPAWLLRDAPQARMFMPMGEPIAYSAVNNPTYIGMQTRQAARDRYAQGVRCPP